MEINISPLFDELLDFDAFGEYVVLPTKEEFENGKKDASFRRKYTSEDIARFTKGLEEKEYIKNEIKRWELYILSIPKENQTKALESLTYKLLTGYYKICHNKKWKWKGNKDYAELSLKLLYDEALFGIILSLRVLHLCYTDSFISHISQWEREMNDSTFTDLLKDLQHIKGNKPGKRAKKDFRSLIQYEDKDKLLKRLHVLIDGKGGSDVGAVLLHCLLQKYISRIPTQPEFESEFELIGTWRSIRYYVDDTNESAKYKAQNVQIFPQ